MSDLPAEISAIATEDEPIVVVNREGVIVAMTPKAEALFGVSADDIVGEFVEMLVPDKMRWGHQAYRRGFLAEPNKREMDPGLEPHGLNPVEETEFPIHVDLVPYQVDGMLYVAAHVTKLDGRGPGGGREDT